MPSAFPDKYASSTDNGYSERGMDDSGGFSARDAQPVRHKPQGVDNTAFQQSLRRSRSGCDDSGLDWSQATFTDDGVSPEKAETIAQAQYRRARLGAGCKDAVLSGKNK